MLVSQLVASIAGQCHMKMVNPIFGRSTTEAKKGHNDHNDLERSQLHMRTARGQKSRSYGVTKF